MGMPDQDTQMKNSILPLPPTSQTGTSAQAAEMSQHKPSSSHSLIRTMSKARVGRCEEDICSSPIRIASPSPHRMHSKALMPVKDDKIDIERVRQRATKSKSCKRDTTPAASAKYTIRGFLTPTMPCGEDADNSGSSTPTHSYQSRYNSSAASSPSVRPATPSGISMLKLQLEALALSSRTSTLRSDGIQIVSTLESGSSQASDSDRTDVDNYGTPCEKEITSPESLIKVQPTSTCNMLPRPAVSRKMSSADFEPMTCLGKGTYGTVILVKHRETGRLFAQKQLKKASLVVCQKLVEQTRTERVILENVNRHPFVVKLFYAFQDCEKLYLILEYAQGGELFHHLNMERMFSEDTAAFYVAEMVLALEHLHHNLGVVYRDLKPENCLLDSEGHLLLTDFGLSKVAIDEDDKCNSFLGTIEYMAPEIVQGHEYGMAVDWWSLGALCHDLLTGAPPFTGNNNAKIQQKIIQCKLHLPYYLSSDAKDLLTRLLRKDVKKRLGSNMPKDLQTIKKHRFFRKIDWKKLEARELEPPIQPIITDPELAENFSTEFTELSLSPRMARKILLSADEPGHGNGHGHGQVPKDLEMMDADDDANDYTNGNPFGGFSFTASQSLLDYGGILDGGVWD